MRKILYVIDDKIFAGYHTIIVHSHGSMSNKYLAYLFQSPTWRYQIRKKVNGVKVYSITQRMLKDAFVLVPPIDEQEEIVAYLDDVCKKIDALIEKEDGKIKDLQDLKNRIIGDVITGEIDVRDIEIPDYEYVSDDVEESDEETDLDESDEEE